MCFLVLLTAAKHTDPMTRETGYRPKFGFDIRVRPPHRSATGRGPKCAWQGCRSKGEYKAPLDRENLRDYQWFCLDHIREFNRGWNFFDGMDDVDVRAFQESMSTGHRPTWKLGSNPWTHGKSPGEDGRSKFSRPFSSNDWGDLFELFRHSGPDDFQARPPQRKIPKRLQGAFSTLGLNAPASPEQIKARYKELVKKFHPDANQGEKGFEERLKEIIEAYQNLKSAGFC